MGVWEGVLSGLSLTYREEGFLQMSEEVATILVKKSRG